MRFERYAILVEIDLKFSFFFLELLQNCLLLIVDIESLNGFDIFKHFRSYFYFRKVGFLNSEENNWGIFESCQEITG